MVFKWDKWQQDFINHKGSCTVRCGRQVGKSTSAGKRITRLMLEYIGSAHLVIAPAQRQSGQLFIKVMSWLEEKNQEMISIAGGYTSNPSLSAKRNMELKRQFEYDHGIYNEIPTKTTVWLKKDFSKPRGIDNQGTVCYALPAGKTGVYLRTFALDFLHIDEAAYVPEPVYTALKPMLAVSAKARGLGWETFLSTPFGKGGFFYESHHSDDYRQWHISAEDCNRIGSDFLRKERGRLSKAEYKQEWCGEFTDDYHQFFPTKLIKECMTFINWSKKEDYNPSASYYYGLDPARYGGDEIGGVIVEELDRKLKAVKCTVAERVSTTVTVGQTCVIDDEFNFKMIFTDDGGLGGAVTDQLIEKLGRRRVMGLNNSSKRVQDNTLQLDWKPGIHNLKPLEKKKGILKEDLYSHTLMLMETGRLELISDLKLLKSMKSITFEYTSDKNLILKGNYSHLTEALVRACWCLKERGLDLYVF